jgi:hypothetical protein
MIYVDEARFGKKRWCHMMTDGHIDELHMFAKSIGLKREWFQDDPLHPHYDLSPGKREQAIFSGANPVTSRQMIINCSEFVRQKKKRGAINQ